MTLTDAAAAYDGAESTARVLRAACYEFVASGLVDKTNHKYLGQKAIELMGFIVNGPQRGV